MTIGQSKVMREASFGVSKNRPIANQLFCCITTLRENVRVQSSPACYTVV